MNPRKLGMDHSKADSPHIEERFHRLTKSNEPTNAKVGGRDRYTIDTVFTRRRSQLRRGSWRMHRL